ncbi:hypothetical protein McanMca71_006085 [Microsporum canis]
MKLSIFLPLTIIAAAVLAADPGPINQLPPCPKGCIYDGIRNSRQFGCSFPSPQCLCRNQKYQQHLHNCAQKCTPAERDQMRQVGTKYCIDSGVPPSRRRRSATPDSAAKLDAQVEQFPVPTNIPGIPGIPGLPSLPIPSVPLPSLPIPTLPVPSWVPTAIPTGLPTGLPSLPIPTAIPTVIPTAIPTAIPPWLISLIPTLPPLPSIPSIPGIPPIPTPTTNENMNQAEAAPNSRLMRGKQIA